MARPDVGGYTKGPWYTNGPRIQYGPMVAGDGFAVAVCFRDDPEWKANARLIAAAPALFEALRELVAASDALLNERETVARWSALMDATSAARAAVAEAGQ